MSSIAQFLSIYLSIYLIRIKSINLSIYLSFLFIKLSVCKLWHYYLFSCQPATLLVLLTYLLCRCVATGSTCASARWYHSVYFVFVSYTCCHHSITAWGTLAPRLLSVWKFWKHICFIGWSVNQGQALSKQWSKKILNDLCLCTDFLVWTQA